MAGRGDKTGKNFGPCIKKGHDCDKEGDTTATLPLTEIEPMKRIDEMILVSLCACLMMLPALASANQAGSHDGTETTTQTTVLFLPGLSFGVMFLSTTGGLSTSASSMTATSLSSTRKLFSGGLVTAEVTTYLRENRHDLSDSIVFGGGQALDDLAHLLEIPEEDYEGFAQRVRDNRHELLPHLHGDLNREEATRFIHEVVQSDG